MCKNFNVHCSWSWLYTADVRVLYHWWSLLSFFYSLVLHCFLLAQKAGVFAYRDKCHQPNTLTLFCCIWWLQKWKAVQNQLCQEVLTEVRDLKETVACREFLGKWSDHLCDCRTHIFFYVNSRMSWSFPVWGKVVNIHPSTRTCKVLKVYWKSRYDQNTWILWENLE